MSHPSNRTSDTDTSGHVWVDHTSEVCVRLHAPSLPELLAEGARAFAELVPAHLGGSPSSELRTFRLDAVDFTATLVAWLNDLVYLAEVERWVPGELTATWEGGGENAESARVILVTARGRTLDRPFVLVKAATLHGAGVERVKTGLEAEVTLDT